MGSPLQPLTETETTLLLPTVYINKDYREAKLFKKGSVLNFIKQVKKKTRESENLFNLKLGETQLEYKGGFDLIGKNYAQRTSQA